MGVNNGGHGKLKGREGAYLRGLALSIILLVYYSRCSYHQTNFVSLESYVYGSRPSNLMSGKTFLGIARAQTPTISKKLDECEIDTVQEGAKYLCYALGCKVLL